MIRFFCGLVSILLIFSMPAYAAQELTSENAQSFVSSLPDVNTLAKQMEKEGKNKIINTKAEPVPGQDFKPYSQSLAVLKQDFSGDYKKLATITDKHGFSSPESWAETGDDVMLAYMASQIKMPANSAMPELTPQMLAYMPPEAKVQYEKSKAVMDMIGRVPQAHKDIVAPLAPSINAFVSSEMPAAQ